MNLNRIRRCTENHIDVKDPAYITMMPGDVPETLQ